MKNTFLLLSISILFFSSTKVFSQDSFFNQYEQAPFNLNPGLTGSFDGSHRIALNLRNQWHKVLRSKSYRTGMLSYDSKKKFDNSNQIGFGFHSLIDRAGSAKLGTNEYNLSSSYSHILGDANNAHHSLALGFTFGLATRQIDPSLIDPMIEAPEFISKRKYVNFSSGLLWNYQSTSRLSFQLGVAAFHINKPNISFFKEGEDNLYTRFVIHGNTEIPVGQKVSIIPSFMHFSQGPNNLLLAGLQGRRYFKSENLSKYIQLGIFLKSPYSPIAELFKNIVFNGLINLDQISVGVSYDRLPFLGGTFEISAGYIINEKKKIEE